MFERYFSVEYGEEYYIFDSEKISKEEVLNEAEYTYKVFRNALTEDEIVELLNEYEDLRKELVKEPNIFEQSKKHITDCKNINARRNK